MKLGSSEEKKAVKWFNKYICLRDLQKDENGEIYGICISSGRKWVANLYSDKSISNGREWCASHYWNADKYGSVRFDERNVNGQFQSLNKYLSGDKPNYEIGLRKKITDEAFEQLNRDRHQLKQHKFEYHNIAETYKQKAKQEAERLGITL